MAGGFIKSQCCCYCKTVWTGVRRKEGEWDGRGKCRQTFPAPPQAHGQEGKGRANKEKEESVKHTHTHTTSSGLVIRTKCIEMMH